ncbi:MAG: ABC transporter transmembrane domain-containing protein [Pseudomonadota bacterium]
MNTTAAQQFAAPSTWRRLDVLAASISINLLTLAMPIVVLQVYDRVLPNQSIETLTLFVSALIVVAITDGFLNFARATLLAKCAAKFEYDTGLRAMSAVLNSDLAQFGSQSHGAHLECFQGIDTIRDFYHGPSTLLVVELPFVVLFLALIWQFSGAMVLIPLAMIGIFALISFFAGINLRHAIENKADHHERRQNFVIECLHGMHTIKALAMEQLMQRRYERLQANSANSVFDLARINSVVQGLAASFSQAVMICFVAIGSIYVVSGDLSVGALAAGTMLAGRVLQPALRALSFWTYRQSVLESERKLNRLLSLPQESMSEEKGAFKINGKIELRSVDFGFEVQGEKLLKDVNLVIEPGESVSIRGPNGAGKSTLLNLIMGFISPDEGEVLIDDHNIKDLDRSSLRSQIGLIPQHGVLFDGSLIDNMTLYRDGKPISEAIQLARKLGLDGTILKLPEGLDTMANSDLSQAIPHGFAQRLVTVRALIGDLSIVLFDDANLGFDDRNDGYLRDMLLELRGDHTVVVVSHRPSLQRICDRHYEIRDGRLVVAGSAAQGKRFGGANVQVLEGNKP